jgi:RNA polymerase-interacting CarD/CdnL/TRCF family regulator
MLHRGAKVVHRIHGAGTVAALFRPDSAPRDGPYYELDLVASDTRVMVPVEGADRTLRSVCSPNAMDRAMEAIQETAAVDGGRGRHERLRASLQTGQALAAAKVICQLRALRQQRRRLTFTDRRILRRATTLLASELALVKDISFDRAEVRVERLAAS